MVCLSAVQSDLNTCDHPSSAAAAQLSRLQWRQRQQRSLAGEPKGSIPDTGGPLTDPAAFTTKVEFLHVPHLSGSVAEQVAHALLASERHVAVRATQCWGSRSRVMDERLSRHGAGAGPGPLLMKGERSFARSAAAATAAQMGGPAQLT